MYCKNCGKKIENNSKFCGNCGEPVKHDISNQEVKSEKKTTQESSEILHIITGINNPSITFSGANGHWGIIFTKEEVFFVKNSSSSWYQGNPGIVFGVVGGIAVSLIKNALSNTKKTETNDLASILQNAKKYYRFSVEQFSQINVKEFLYKQAILLNGVEPKTLEIFIPKAQYGDFMASMKKFYKYDLSV